MVKRSPQRAGVRAEPLERRALLSAADLTETVTAATVSHLSTAAALSAKATVAVSNASGTTQKDAVVVLVYAATTPLDPSGPRDADVLLGFTRASLNLADGQTRNFTFGLKLKAGALPVGTYGLYGVVTDTAVASVASTGPTLTVAAPDIRLSETESFAKLPTTVAAGGKFAVTDRVAIANGGADASSGPVTVDVYASPDGLVADGTRIGTVTRKLRINAGKTAALAVPLKVFPTVPAGTYHLVTQVTDPNGVATTVDSATVTVPAGGSVGGAFTSTVSLAKVRDTFDVDTSVVTQTVTLTMLFANTGAVAIDEPLTITAYVSDTSGTPETLVGTATYTLSAKPKQKVRAVVTPTAQTIPTGGDGVATATDFVVVTVTDPTGATQTVTYAKKVGVDVP